MQSELTKVEKSWLRKVQNLLNKCPSDRIGFYTIGDKDLTVYDYSKEAEITEYNDNGTARDFSEGVDEFEASLGGLIFPNQVHSVAG
jgi:hypothetical protein